MISKTSAEEIMERYDGHEVAVYDGRAESNCTEGYIVGVWADCMVICSVYTADLEEHEHHLVALNTIVKVQVFPKAE